MQAAVRRIDGRLRPLELTLDEMRHELFHHAARPPTGLRPEEFAAWVHHRELELGSRPEPEWGRWMLRVEGRDTEFLWLREAEAWVAAARLGEVDVRVLARGISPQEVEMVRIEDVEPYIEGHRDLRRGGGP